MDNTGAAAPLNAHRRRAFWEAGVVAGWSFGNRHLPAHGAEDVRGGGGGGEESVADGRL